MMRFFKKNTQDTSDETNHVAPLAKETLDQQEFDSFFAEVLKKMPQKSARVILNAYDQSKIVAEKILAKNQAKFDHVFKDFLKGVDETTRKKSHRIIHAASL